ncbi:dienelactone hydrolase family protein [Phenylobacterium immobile]|uniref:dienelactone hydrolase family protein n=1 Tax=Phenylobacterium immobile TaxID=21 RepID=UPI000A959200|nr:dienelactone hydrolase family protein [Phenylobacterium immobile]
MCDERDDGPGAYTEQNRRGYLRIASGGVAGAVGAGAASAGVEERAVKITTPDGEADAALFVPKGAGAKPGVIYWPDIFGLRPAAKDMGRRLAGDGYVVLVVNPFYRGGEAEELSAKAAGFEGFMQKVGFFRDFRMAMSGEAVAADAKAYVDFLDALPETSDAKVGVQGYSMGGALAFMTAGAAPDRVGGVASFHGGGLTTDQPSSPHLIIGKTDAAYLVCVAKNDDEKEPQSKDILNATFEETGKTGSAEVYAADHGWCVPDMPAYDQAEAERAWANLLETYKAALV